MLIVFLSYLSFFTINKISLTKVWQ